MNYLQTKGPEFLTTTAGSATVAFGLSYNEIGVIVGILGLISGLATQLYFGHRRDRRDREFHQKRMKD